MSPELKETLRYLEDSGDWPKYEQVFNVIANLMFESKIVRRTAAEYHRVFNLDKLKITIDYGDKYAEQK